MVKETSDTNANTPRRISGLSERELSMLAIVEARDADRSQDGFERDEREPQPWETPIGRLIAASQDPSFRQVPPEDD
jgi:hypothetical protein